MTYNAFLCHCEERNDPQKTPEAKLGTYIYLPVQ